MTKPKPLSPSAQAVLDAAKEAYWLWDEMCPADPDTIAAAALRAVAHKVVPFPGRYPVNEYMEGIRDAKQYVHQQLLAIADELNGVP